MTQSVMGRFIQVVRRVKYPGFDFVVLCRPGRNTDTYALQIICDDTCNETGLPKTWKSRKWLLSEHMTDGEIVQTAFKATMTAIEHETRERFSYRGVSLFDPHYDIEKLAELRGAAGSIKGRDHETTR